MSKDVEKVQIWCSKETRRRLRMLAARGDTDIMDAIKLSAEALEHLTQAAERKNMTVPDFLEWILSTVEDDDSSISDKD